MKETIDLSHTIRNGMPVYPGTEVPVLEKCCTIASDGFAELKISMLSHVGTHLDVPAHLLPGGKNLSEFGISNFCGSALVVKYDQATALTADVVKHRLQKYGTPEFILLSCNWDRFWGQESYYSNFPVPSAELAEFLASLGLKGIGIDAISVDPVHATTLINHQIFLGSGMIIIENLKNLHAIPPGIFDFYCLPLKLENSDGAPVRAIAQF